MEEELVVVLNRRDDPTAGLGFSLLDKPGFPPVIYDIEENSPAAECGKVEAGDVIVKVNDVDVGKYSIKEVLKCLRLAGSTVVLKLKRDQTLKEKILFYLASSSENAENELLSAEQVSAGLTNGNGVACGGRPNNIGNGGGHLRAARRKELHNSAAAPFFAPLQDITSAGNLEKDAAGSVSTSSSSAAAAAGNQPLCEAYVMTGERVLKLTKNPSLAPKYQKKVDSLKAQQNLRKSHAAAAAAAAASAGGAVTASEAYLRHNKSTPSSPVESEYAATLDDEGTKCASANTSPVTLGAPLKMAETQAERGAAFAASVSKSDDYIRYSKSSVSMSSTSVQVDDEDITSSLNTLLDTSADSSSQRRQPRSEADDDPRVLWSCTAAVRPNTARGSSSTIASCENISSQPSITPPSPTSVSSSVMSSSSSSTTDRKRPQGAGGSPHHHHHHRRHAAGSNGTSSSQMEALSNISSPDYQEEASDLLNSNDMGMEVTDPSDSDSTLLVSEPKIRRLNKCVGSDNHELNGLAAEQSNHRIVIQVKGADKDKSQNPCDTTYVIDNSKRHHNSLREEDEESAANANPKKVGYEALGEYDDELIALTEGAANLAKSISPTHCGSPEEESGSDVESLHSFHYSPKGVDYPSAHRLAKRLFHLDGFKKSDVSRHLSKNNEFNRAVAEEYLKHFNFVNDSLDEALRKFLKQFSLTGETQERERVLVHFSKRYLDCNPGSFSSQDAVHTLTCAIMLLNTDLHGQNIGRKMTCNAFIDNLAGLNDDENFPKEVLKALYQAIKSAPLEWAVDEDVDENVVSNTLSSHNRADAYDEQSDYLMRADGTILKKGDSNANGDASVIDYKKGYVLRKCCHEPNGKRTPLGKRGWKMMHCALRDLVLYLHKDEQELNKNQTYDHSHNVIKLHHALAMEAKDYKKKACVFRLQTADRAEYLFQTSDVKELQSWVDTINLVCASFSAPALPEPVGSLKKFQRPLLPSAPSRLNLREQLKEHEMTVERLEMELENHRKQAPDKSSKNLVIQNHHEKESYLLYEIKRYKAYVHVLQSKLPQLVTSMSAVPLADSESDEENIMVSTMAEEEAEETTPATAAAGPPANNSSAPASVNRYSYRAAIYSNGGDASGGIG